MEGAGSEVAPMTSSQGDSFQPWGLQFFRMDININLGSGCLTDLKTRPISQSRGPFATEPAFLAWFHSSVKGMQVIVAESRQLRGAEDQGLGPPGSCWTRSVSGPPDPLPWSGR